MTALKWIGAGVVGLAVIVGLIIGGWRLGWWMTARGTNYQNHIFQHSYGAQSAYKEQLRQAVVDIDAVAVQISDPSTPQSEKAALTAQRAAMVNQACDIASKVTDNALTPDEASFVATNCQGATP